MECSSPASTARRPCQVMVACKAGWILPCGAVKQDRWMLQGGRCGGKFQPARVYVRHDGIKHCVKLRRPCRLRGMGAVWRLPARLPQPFPASPRGLLPAWLVPPRPCHFPDYLQASSRTSTQGEYTWQKVNCVAIKKPKNRNSRKNRNRCLWAGACRRLQLARKNNPPAASDAAAAIVCKICKPAG